MAKAGEERVTVLNPNTGGSSTIRKDMYEPVRDAIVAALTELDEVPFSDLNDHVEARTPAELWKDNSLGWYTVSVKLDLEARGVLVKEGKPQRLRLA